MRAIPTAPVLGLIHEFEQGPDGGCAYQPYQDPAGLWTIGWGHRLPGPLAPGAAWTAQTCDAQAIEDVTTAASGVSDSLGDSVDILTDGQYAALIDFAFNLGVGAFSGSTLRHMIVVGAFHLVPAQFMLWVHGRVNGVEMVLPGLVRRRTAEVQVWNS